MSRFFIFVVATTIAHSVVAKQVEKPKAVVVKHEGLQAFELRGNSITGIATKSQGAKQFEVWHASIAPKSSTPPHHRHETEEVFIFLKGEGKAIVDGVETTFKAPCTVILPAGVPHQVFNLGEEATDHFVVIGIGSKIFDQNDQEMQLPWRL